MSKYTLQASAGFEVEVTVVDSPEGTPLIFIGTPALAEDAKGPICRVYLNDDCLFENPTYEEEQEI